MMIMMIIYISMCACMYMILITRYVFYCSLHIQQAQLACSLLLVSWNSQEWIRGDFIHSKPLTCHQCTILQRKNIILASHATCIRQILI